MSKNLNENAVTFKDYIQKIDAFDSISVSYGTATITGTFQDIRDQNVSTAIDFYNNGTLIGEVNVIGIIDLKQNILFATINSILYNGGGNNSGTQLLWSSDGITYNLLSSVANTTEYKSNAVTNVRYIKFFHQSPTYGRSHGRLIELQILGR